MADEMDELKRELEALKLQLEQERKKNAAADSKHKTESPKSKRQPGGDPKTSTAASASKELRVGCVQHAAVGSRCGKWWLRDRQVLSRATAAEDGVATLKVRETWAWSGRTVVLDKIVRLDEESQQRQQVEVDAEEEEEEAELGAKESDATKGSQPSAKDAAVEDAVSSEPTTAEQPSEAAETSEPATTSAAEALDSSAGKGEGASAKASDEVRESSAAEPRADEASDAPA